MVVVPGVMVSNNFQQLNNSAEQLKDLEKYSQVRIMSLLPDRVKVYGPRTNIAELELPWAVPSKGWILICTCLLIFYFSCVYFHAYDRYFDILLWYFKFHHFGKLNFLCTIGV